jgi:hypothetical protein
MTPTVQQRFAAATLLCLALGGCGGDVVDAPQVSPADVTATVEPQVRAFCGGCHATPRPDSYPRAAWYEEVRRGYDFYHESGRLDLQPPVQAAVVAWYQERAPEKLPLAVTPSTPSPIRFRVESLEQAAFQTGPDPAVSFLDWQPHDRALWLSDMRHGLVVLAPLAAGGSSMQWRACAHPVAVRECDLDGNGVNDLVMADLGSFLPEDHDRGRLVWQRDGARDPEATPQVLLDGVGRIADVRVADLNGNGRLDLVVAEFGWHRTGGIHILWNQPSPSDADALPTFSVETIDRRPGTIHVPVADLDGDGRLDIVALISQEHESVTAFLNRPDGFQPVTLYQAPDPSWGSSGIELVDLDQDGDLDVLYTNGDTFDSYVVKPYHGITWLENTGDFPFRSHSLAAMPGVHRALAADLDGDGDLDIVAAALIPGKLRDQTDASGLDAVLWLEQVAPGRFVRHTLRTGDPAHAAIAVGDFDRNGDLDFVVGCFWDGPSAGNNPAALVFWNDGPVNTPAAQAR